MAYTRSTLTTLKDEVTHEISLLGGHPRLVMLIEKLDAQLDATCGGATESF